MSANLKIISVVLSFFLAASIPACTEPRIDGSDEASFRESVDRIKENLSEDEARKLDSCIMVIAMKDVEMEHFMFNTEKAEDFFKNVLSTLDGKTAEEIFQKAEEM